MTILSAIVMLGILIFVHELGHFLFAKMMGVGVLKFSLGFGPKIIGKKLGETEYQLSAVPLGGYVKMIGEDVGDEFSEEDMERAFQLQPIWKRMLIVFAGPAFNILLAYLVYTTILIAHIPVTIPDISSFMPVIGEVKAGAPASLAGLKAGDRVVKIGEKDIDTWFDMVKELSENPGKTLDVRVERNGDILEKQITPKPVEVGEGGEKKIIGQIGVMKLMKPVIGEIREGSPAAEAGLMKEDLIIRVGERKVDAWFAVVEAVRSGSGSELPLTIKRNSRAIHKIVSLKGIDLKDDDQEHMLDQIGMQKAGVRFFYTIESKTFGEALYKGGVATTKIVFFIYDSLELIISGQVSWKNVGGPVTIVKESGKAAAAGVLPYFLFMALFSVNLGILNLLPVPILDGGHLLLFTLEGIKGGPLNEKAVNIVNRVGLAFLLALMVFVVYNDIVRLLTE